MTFRYGPVVRWIFPILITPFAAVIWWSMQYTGFQRFRYDPVAILGAAALVIAFVLAYVSWLVWTTRVTLSDQWIEWKRGMEYHSLGLNQVSSLGYRHVRTGLRVGLVDRESGLLHPLPLMTRRLYEVLRGRFGGLPSDVESDLFR